VNIRSATITAIGSYLPPRMMTNDELAAMIGAASKRYEIPEELIHMNIDRVAETEASGFKEGRKIPLAGFGAGLIYGRSLITWHRS